MTNTTKYDCSGKTFYSKMFIQYVETALWSSTDNSVDDDRSFEYHNADIDDITQESLQSMWDDCVAFADETEWYRGDISADDMGHNFWLNRNGHGAGFWDMDFSYADGCDDNTGNKLSDASKVWGSSDIYRGDDGLIYVS
jgi:hypothetical protein